jgi:hypothetical protein
MAPMTDHYDLVSIKDFTPDQVKQMWRDMEAARPDLWRKCYPRMYREYKSNEYHSPKMCARQMMGVGLKVEQGWVGQSEYYEIVWASNLAKYGVPMQWVTKDMMQAIMQTVPPIELDWYNMKLPFPAMTFMIPRGTLVHPTEGDATFVSYSRLRIGESVPALAVSPRNGALNWVSANGGMIFFANTHDGGHLIHWNMPYEHFPVADLSKLDDLVMKYEDHEHSSGWLHSPTMTHEDTLFGAKVAHFIFGALLLMDRKPELISKGSFLKHIGSGKERTQLWSPSILGEHYRIKREGAKMGIGSIHASPRGHWVRGFWREQRHGVKLSLTKDVWIEPFWRGGEEAA